jgi:hypothetical protein
MLRRRKGNRERRNDMEPVSMETQTPVKRSFFPSISWGAILGGFVSGMASYLVLTLMGLAVGLSAIDPQSGEPVGRVPMMTGIWTGLSMVASAFIGGYVATRLSGLTRKTDGLLHGFVAWGVSTLFFTYLVTTSVGTVLGGAFSALGTGIKATGGAATGAVGAVASSPDAKKQLQSLLTGSGKANFSKESVDKLQNELRSGDRDGAINVLVRDMGFTRDRAVTVVDQGLTLYGSAAQRAGEIPAQAREVASTAVSGAKTAFIWLSVGILLSMGLSMSGGTVGARMAARRRIPLHH